MSLLFFCVGLFLIYLGITFNDASVLNYIGGFFIVFTIFFFGFTMPSSLLYYYEKAIIKKYGSYTDAVVINKYVEDLSYNENTDGRTVRVEEFHYIIDYQFTYLKDYTNTFYLEHKTSYDKIEIGSKIPIKFLKIKPEQAEPRRHKLSKDLGLGTNACN